MKVPPQSLDSEKALIGAILLRPESVYEIMDIISPETFYGTNNKITFRTVLEMVSKSVPVDSVSLAERLKEKREFDKVGGNKYLTELMDSVPSASNIKHYAETIQKKKLMRDLIGAADDISGLGQDESRELEDILDEAEKKIFAVTNMNITKNYTELKEVVGEAFERLDRLHKSDGALRGVPSGFKSLDNKLSGFQKSDLIILAARPSMGKTSLALNIARNVATKHNIPVQIFSLEMSADQLVDRMVSSQSGVNSWNIRTGKGLTEDHFKKIGEAISTLGEAPIYINDEAGTSIIRMKSVARRVKSEKGLGLIIVDYLQLMSATNIKSDNMVAQVTEISRSLKALARELDVPVIALSQLSRNVEHRGGKPRLSDLRDSGSIEQDADLVMFIHRDDKINEDSDKPNIAEIMIEKHRNGPTGRVELFFDEGRTSFMEIDKQHDDPVGEF
jgi:replicative DNA helicase